MVIRQRTPSRTKRCVESAAADHTVYLTRYMQNIKIWLETLFLYIPSRSPQQGAGNKVQLTFGPFLCIVLLWQDNSRYGSPFDHLSGVLVVGSS